MGGAFGRVSLSVLDVSLCAVRSGVRCAAVVVRLCLKRCAVCVKICAAYRALSTPLAVRSPPAVDDDLVASESGRSDRSMHDGSTARLDPPHSEQRLVMWPSRVRSHPPRGAPTGLGALGLPLRPLRLRAFAFSVDSGRLLGCSYGCRCHGRIILIGDHGGGRRRVGWHGLLHGRLAWQLWRG